MSIVILFRAAALFAISSTALSFSRSSSYWEYPPPPPPPEDEAPFALPPNKLVLLFGILLVLIRSLACPLALSRQPRARAARQQHLHTHTQVVSPPLSTRRKSRAQKSGKSKVQSRWEGPVHRAPQRRPFFLLQGAKKDLALQRLRLIRIGAERCNLSAKASAAKLCVNQRERETRVEPRRERESAERLREEKRVNAQNVVENLCQCYAFLRRKGRCLREGKGRALRGLQASGIQAKRRSSRENFAGGRSSRLEVESLRKPRHGRGLARRHPSKRRLQVMRTREDSRLGPRSTETPCEIGESG